MIKTDAIAVEILKRCDGIATLSRDHRQSRRAVRGGPRPDRHRCPGNARRTHRQTDGGPMNAPQPFRKLPRNDCRAGRHPGRTDPSLPARLPLLLQSDRTRRPRAASSIRRPGSAFSPKSAAARHFARASFGRRAGGAPRSRRDRRTLRAMSASTPISSPRALASPRRGCSELADAGLDHVQLSIQDAEAESADHIAGYQGRLRPQDGCRQMGE